MAPRSKQLELAFRNKEVGWLPKETEIALVEALAELLANEIDGGGDGSEDDDEDHS